MFTTLLDNYLFGEVSALQISCNCTRFTLQSDEYVLSRKKVRSYSVLNLFPQNYWC